MELSLKAVRINNNLTQKKLADLINVSSSTLSRWELGELKIPDDKLEEICSICHIKKGDISLKKGSTTDGNK